MRKIIFVLIAAFLIGGTVNADAQNGYSHCKLRVTVDGFKNNRGFVKIGLCNSKEAFQLSEERAVINATVPIVKGKAEYVFQEVPAGHWAVSAYHDENGNGKLDKGLFEKPTELYGFSNNARGIFSRPDFEQAVVVLDKPEMAVTVTVR